MARFHDLGGVLTLPQMIEIDTTEACNLRCRMCHVSFMPVEKRPIFDIGLLSRLKALKGCNVSVASGFEPMLYPQFDQLMRGLTDMGMRLTIITNGTLLDRKRLDTLLAADMEVINFSFDGIRKETYEYIRRRADYEQTLDRIATAREAFRGRDTTFLVNSTVMRRNLDETIETIDFWDRLDFEVVRFLLMVVRHPEPELVRESLYPIRDHAKQVFEDAALHVIRNNLRALVLLPFQYDSEVARRYPEHVDRLYVRSGNSQARPVPSLRERFQRGAHPLMPYYDCRAAFNSASILANGDVQLCYKYSIGNLAEAAFEDIWFSERARRVREQITNSTKDCDTCDCYRYGIAFHQLSADRIENYFAQELLPALAGVDFETGRFSIAPPARPPRLVATENGYNLVFYGDKYIAIPHTSGALEIDKVDLATFPGVFVETSHAKALELIRSTAASPPATPPRLLKAYLGYNLVQFRDQFYAVAQHAGALDLASEQVRTALACRRDGSFFSAPSLAEAERLVDQSLRAVRPASVA